MWDYKTSLHHWDELKYIHSMSQKLMCLQRNIVIFFYCGKLEILTFYFVKEKDLMMVKESQTCLLFWKCYVFTALCIMMPYQMEKKKNYKHYWKFHWRTICPDSRWLRLQWERDTDLKGFCWSFKVTVATYCTAYVQNRRWNSVWKHRCRAKVNEPSTPSPLLHAAASCVLTSINHHNITSETWVELL